MSDQKNKVLKAISEEKQKEIHDNPITTEREANDRLKKYQKECKEITENAYQRRWTEMEQNAEECAKANNTTKAQELRRIIRHEKERQEFNHLQQVLQKSHGAG